MKLSNEFNAGGLCDGAEVSIQYEIEEANGKAVPWGLDMSWNAVLPAGASVLFSVSKSHLENRRTVFVSYTYLKESEQHMLEEYGTTRRVSFRSARKRFSLCTNFSVASSFSLSVCFCFKAVSIATGNLVNLSFNK